MIRPELAKWGQTIDDVRQLAVEAVHARTRERFQAVYMIGSEQSNATLWAAVIGRNDETVLQWVHRYNAAGPDALRYHRTGGIPPFLAKRRLRKS
jgi:transposase